jgi:hypothetical protein
MDRARYRRLLDSRRSVEVVLPDRRRADWYGIDCVLVDRSEAEGRAGRAWAAQWHRGGSVLTLLAHQAGLAPRPPQPPTGSLGRRLRERRCRA